MRAVCVIAFLANLPCSSAELGQPNKVFSELNPERLSAFGELLGEFNVHAEASRPGMTCKKIVDELTSAHGNGLRATEFFRSSEDVRGPYVDKCGREFLLSVFAYSPYMDNKDITELTLDESKERGVQYIATKNIEIFSAIDGMPSSMVIVRGTDMCKVVDEPGICGGAMFSLVDLSSCRFINATFVEDGLSSITGEMVESSSALYLSKEGVLILQVENHSGRTVIVWVKHLLSGDGNRAGCNIQASKQ